MALLSPRVKGPLSECSSSISVEGQLSGSTVRVFADGKLVAEGQSVWNAISLDLLPGKKLNPGSAVVAEQSLENETSPVSPEPVIVQKKPPQIGGLAFNHVIYECGECLSLQGAVPGAKIEVRAGASPGTGIRGTATSRYGNAKVELSPPTSPLEVLIAQQEACGELGLKTPSGQANPLLVEPLIPGEKLPPPTVEGPLKECQRSLQISNVIPGAVVTLERSEGSTFINDCFAKTKAWLENITPLVAGEKIVVRQGFPACEKISPDSKTYIVKPKEPIPPPAILGGELCEGTTSVPLTNLIPGSKVRIFLDETEIGLAEAPRKNFAFLVPPLGAGTLTARQELCDEWSKPSNKVKVTGDVELLQPELAEPLYECGGAVRVTGVLPGTWVYIWSQMLGAPIGQAWAFTEVVDVTVSPLLSLGDEITARSVGCGGQESLSNAVTVKASPELEAPKVLSPVFEGDPTIPVGGVIPGALVEVFVNNWWRGGRFISTKSDKVPVSGYLKAGDQYAARQRLCARISEVSGSTTVLHAPPVAMFKAEPSEGTVPLTVNFKNLSTGTIASYEWDFDYDPESGDGAFVHSTQKNPTHTYDKPGDYIVFLSVTNPDGWHNWVTQEIKVFEEPMQPTDPVPDGASKVCIFNCHVQYYDVNVWVLDETENTGWQEVKHGLDHQYDNSGSCPGQGSPFEMDLTDGHIYHFRVLDPDSDYCSGENDPLNGGCIKLFFSIKGDDNGEVACVAVT
jgi:hypothetical protein